MQTARSRSRSPASSKQRPFNPHLTHGWPHCASPLMWPKAVLLLLEAAIHTHLTPAPSTAWLDPWSHSLQSWNREEGWVWSLKAAGRSGLSAGDARSLGRKASSCFSSTASLGLAGVRICPLFQTCRGAGLSIAALEKSFPCSVSVMTPGHFSQLCPRHHLTSGRRREPAVLLTRSICLA